MKSCSITDFGAKCGCLCTKEIQSAVDNLEKEGGGILYFPAGLYISGTLYLKSNIIYHLEAGAVLKASGNIADFPYIGFRHHEMGETKSLICALNKENIVIEGMGCIDLSCESYDDFSKIYDFGTDVDTLTEKQRSECVVQHIGNQSERLNQPLFFESCKNFQIRDITVKNAPCWSITFSRCHNIKIYGINIDNLRNVGNSDGIHLSACKDVNISDCNISAGDDCIAITCITAEEPEDICERVTVTNCNLKSSSAGIRIGHFRGKVRNIAVSNLTITDSNRGIAIFAHNEGYVENVVISNLIIETKMLCGAWWGKGEPFVICAANSSGHISDVRIKNVIAHGNSGIIIGGKDKNVKNISISDMTLHISKSPNHDILGGYIDFRMNDYIEFNKKDIPYIYASDVENLKLNDVQYYKEDRLDYSIEAVIK